MEVYLNMKHKNSTLATSSVLVAFVFIFFGFIPEASAQFTQDKVNQHFEKFVDKYQDKGLCPFEIAVKIKAHMAQLIQQSASTGITLKQITALVKAAAGGAVAGCRTQPTGYDLATACLPHKFVATCTSRSELPLETCAESQESRAQGALRRAYGVVISISPT